MDITDGASSLAGSSSGPGPETAQPEAPNEPSESNEVSVYEDLHIVREIVLEGDRPADLSDDDSAIGVDDDSDASSVASSAVAMEDAEPEPLEPPAEDHSVQRLEAHKEPVFAVAVCAARPEIFATGGGDDVAHLWRVGEAAPSCRFEGHADSISSLGFSADGTMLATAGLDGTVRVWSADGTGQLIAALEGPSQGVTWLAWHTRGAVLLAGSEDATAWMWKLPEGNVMQIFSAHSAAVTYGAFVNNGRNVVTASEDGTVRVWNPRTGTVDYCLHAGLRAEEPRPVTCLAAHNSQPVFMFGTDEGGLKVRPRPKARSASPQPHVRAPTCSSLAPPVRAPPLRWRTQRAESCLRRYRVTI